MENQEEIWKDIVGCEGRYQVSNKGGVMALKNIVPKKNGVVAHTRAKMLKLEISFGYACVSIRKNGKKCKVRVHREIAIAFLPNPFNKPYINHINGVRNDNRLENLEWCTPKENVSHAINIGLTNNKGEQSSNAKLTNEHVLKIRELSSNGMSAYKIKKEIGLVSIRQISDIVRRICWNHI